MRFLLEILSSLKAIKSIFKGHVINRILHSWPFHIVMNKTIFVINIIIYICLQHSNVLCV